MTETHIRADVFLDGTLMASTAAEFYDQKVTVLEGLKVDWGRATAIDQPDPASLGLTFLQKEGGGDFLRSLTVGRTIDVTASGRIPGGDSGNVLTDGDFESLPVGSVPPSIRSNVATLTVTETAPGTLTRTNYATNPNFEKDLAGWRLEGGAILERNTIDPISGTADGFIIGGDVYSQPFPPAVEGDIYTLSLDYRTDGPVTGTPRLHLGQSGGTLVGSKQTPLPLNQPAPARFAVSIGPLGVGATGVIAAIFGAPEGVHFDNVLIEKAPAATPYFDGNSPDAPPLDYRWTGAPNASTSQEVSGGNQAAKFKATDATLESWAIFPPAPFSSDPTAWDQIPRTSHGQTWQASASVWALLPSRVYLQAVAFTSPDGTAGTYVPFGPILDAPGVADWVDLILADIPIEQSGRWIGLQVTFSRLGLAWAETADTWADQAGTWLDQAQGYVDNLAVSAPAEGTDRSVLVFRGRITDMEASYKYHLAGGSTQVNVTAKDFTADLSNVRIGDEPWPVESLESRTDKILALSGTGVVARVDPSVAETLVSYRDVDSQGAAGLISELAASVGAVAWAAVHDPPGDYYWIEDPRNRAALYWLQMGDDGQAYVAANPNAEEAIRLTAHNVLADPISWDQDVADVATRADVTWLEQGIDDEGKPTTTERHHVVIDRALETELGQRGFSLSTQLISSADAAEVATGIMASQHAHEWRLSGITWAIRYEDELTQAETVAALDLLDGTVRIGHSLSITELPPWVPVSGAVVVYIEGGTYTFEGGNWWLELTGSSGGSGASVSWDQVDPTWPWTSFQGLSWLDLIGVSAPPTTG
jgi:hypothetical protein